MIYSHSCQYLDCVKSISSHLIMCPDHWALLPITFQRKLLSSFDSTIKVEFQNDEFNRWLRRARISIACQVKLSVTLNILPDHEFLALSEKQALNELIQRYMAC